MDLFPVWVWGLKFYIGLETLTEEIVEATDPENIENRIHTAIIKYRRYNATLDDKKDAIRTLADVLEHLKSQDIRLPSKDDSDLFNIINNFDIRHHRRSQQSSYDSSDATARSMFSFSFLCQGISLNSPSF